MQLTELKSERNRLWGMIIYEIVHQDGFTCLNGLCKNNLSPNEIINEIARKRDEPNATIAGDYSFAYIDTLPISGAVRGRLCVENTGNGSFELKWFENNSPIPLHEGIGFIINKQLVATYWEV